MKLKSLAPNFFLKDKLLSVMGRQNWISLFCVSKIVSLNPNLEKKIHLTTFKSAFFDMWVKKISYVLSTACISPFPARVNIERCTIVYSTSETMWQSFRYKMLLLKYEFKWAAFLTGMTEILPNVVVWWRICFQTWLIDPITVLCTIVSVQR